MDRGAWRATVHGVAKDLDTTWQLNNSMTVVTFAWKAVSVTRTCCFPLNLFTNRIKLSIENKLMVPKEDCV